MIRLVMIMMIFSHDFYLSCTSFNESNDIFQKCAANDGRISDKSNLIFSFLLEFALRCCCRFFFKQKVVIHVKRHFLFSVKYVLCRYMTTFMKCIPLYSEYQRSSTTTTPGALVLAKTSSTPVLCSGG
jgi:hypothetical protein